MPLPHYDLKTFRETCGTTVRHSEFFISPDALRDAMKHFNLKNKAEILYSIDTDLESLVLDNSTPKKMGARGLVLIVDSYFFKLDGIDGYLAFLFNSEKGNWFIKSFHDPRGGKAFGQTLSNKLIDWKPKGHT